MKVFLKIFLFASLCSFFSLHDLFWKQTLVYTKTKDGKAVEEKWQIKSRKQQFHIVGHGPDSTSQLLYNSDYALLKYQYKNPDDDDHFFFEKQDDRLFAKGIVAGQAKTAMHNIGNSPWVQQFGFGLKPFVKSSERKMEFVIINPKDFSINTLIAIKQGIESLTIGDKDFHAQKIKITLPGFKGMFWSASIWFDLKTNLFIKYEGNEGPGTATTVTTLTNSQ